MSSLSISSVGEEGQVVVIVMNTAVDIRFKVIAMSGNELILTLDRFGLPDPVVCNLRTVHIPMNENMTFRPSAYNNLKW